VGGLLLAAAGLFILYFRQSQVASFNSDGAAQVLQAQAMLHGNLLLRGWWTGDVSFYTTELPEYMLVDLFRGLRVLGETLLLLFGANGQGNRGPAFLAWFHLIGLALAGQTSLSPWRTRTGRWPASR